MFKVREIVVIMLLIICTITDIKERNIYFMPVLTSIILAFSFTIYEIVYSPLTDRLYILQNWIVWPFCLVLMLMILIYISKGGIGAGDGYMVAATGFLIGMNEILTVIFFASVIGMSVCIYMILLDLIRHAKIKRTIPYAPILLSGFYAERIIRWYIESISLWLIE